MALITAVRGREILDSKGDPTVEVELTFSDGTKTVDCAPSGTSSGDAEALELRDGDESQFFGKGTLKAVAMVNTEIAQTITGREIASQDEFDQTLIRLDGTPNKARLGANAILPTSMAFARGLAVGSGKRLFEHFGIGRGDVEFKMPRPMVLLLEGGKHGGWSTDVQEYMILPKEGAFDNFLVSLEACLDVFRTLETILIEKKYAVGVGLEGAFCPSELESNEAAFGLIVAAIEKAGYRAPEQFGLVIDAAASEYFGDGKYTLRSEDNKAYESEAWLEKIVDWTRKYPIVSIEDPFDQEAWDNWAKLTAQIGDHVQIVGDDLIVTNVERIKKAHEKRSINSALIKLNQIGTVSETIAAVAEAKSYGWTTIMSHRSGETNDDFVADMAVGLGCPQVKFGGPDRGERIAKYNQLLRIQESL